ncbi:MAG: acyl-CoA dehydrogenase family protein [Acidimicrobiia bacterium]
MTTNPTGTLLLPDMTAEERDRSSRVDSVLPVLLENAVMADRDAVLPRENVEAIAAAGLLGLIIPEQYGGLGGNLRDLAAATFALGTACPSTALAYFFHCSATSRGVLPLEAVEAGLFDDAEADVVRSFGELVLGRMVAGKWMANFASESVKTAKTAISIATEASKVDGGWSVSGVKAFGCGTGVADDYLVTARIPGGDTAEYLGVFLVDPGAVGVSERPKWDALGMRGSAAHGVILDNVFVEDAHALAVPGAFIKMMQMSRGSFVGNQPAGTAVYLGAAKATHDFTLGHLTRSTFKDTGEPIGTADFQRQLVAEMREALDTGLLWMRRQIALETEVPPPLPKDQTVATWRIAKGTCAEASMKVATCALKACGTSNTGNSGLVARSLRDISMGLVQAFPPERGRLEAGLAIVTGSESAQFGGTG